MIYEKKHQPLLRREKFVIRIIKSLIITLFIVFGALGFGICGYMTTEGMPFLDALLNASMILGGMGPVSELHTNAGKVFASFYALFSGLMLITITGIIATPVIHRMLHAFHAEGK